MREVVDIERVEGAERRWRATGYGLDEQGRVVHDLGGWRQGPDGVAVHELGVEVEADSWAEAVELVHRAHPDVPGSSGGWVEVAAGRWQWAHERHHARPGSARNPHRVEIRMPTRAGPSPVHESVAASPVRRRRRWWWPWG